MHVNFPEDRLLRIFVTLPVLTIAQMTRLLYSSGSSRYVSALLKQLTDNHYLTRQALPSTLRVGSVPYVYSLAQRGRSYLVGLGYDLSGRYVVRQTGSRSYPFLAHTLAITDVLIAAMLLPKYNNSLTVADVRHDVTLKGLLHGYVVPDGFMDIRIRDSLQHCFFLELDRGTESKRQLRQKILGLLRLIQPAPGTGQSVYEQIFATTSLTICYAIVAQPEKRLTDMIRWTDEVLTETGNTRERDLFRFVRIPEGPLDPVWFFLTPIWRRIEGASLVSILEL